MLIVGLTECVAAGWIYNLDGLIVRCGQLSVVLYAATWFSAVVVMLVIAWLGPYGEAHGLHSVSLQSLKCYYKRK